MKYQEIVMARSNGPRAEQYRQFYVPVAQQDGRWLPCGDMREETHRYSQATMGIGITECDPDTNDCGPLSDIPAPDGWTVVSRLWLNDDYVPPSDEVLEETDRRAVQQMKDLGLWKNPE